MANLRSAAPGGGIHSFNKGCSTPIVTSEGAVKLNKQARGFMEFSGKDGGKKGGEGRERLGLCFQLFPFCELSAQSGAP